MLATFVAPAPSAATFEVLPDLDGGGEECFAYGLSADGEVVVGASLGALGTEAFVWTEEAGMVGLGDLPGPVHRSTAWGVSADGRTIVGWGTNEAGIRRAVRWVDGGSPEDLGSAFDRDEFPFDWSETRDVSDDGRTIVGWSGSGGLAATVWRDGEVRAVPDLKWLNAASADGAVRVGKGPVSSSDAPYVWIEGDAPFPIGPPPQSPNGTGWGVSADGDVVVGTHDSRAFRWSSRDGFEVLTSEHYRGTGLDVSADGSVVLGHRRHIIGFVTDAFLWRRDGGARLVVDVLQDLGLDLDGIRLTQGGAISDDGRTLVGTGGADGRRFCWRATLPAACSNGLDDDGDGLIDDEDPGCLDSEDDDERHRDDVAIELLPVGAGDRLAGGESRRLAVAIFGSPTIDIDAIDLSSLEGGSAAAAPLDPPAPRRRDVDRDGFEDLVVTFASGETGVEPGDRQLCLRGEAGGVPFEACDAIRTWPPARGTSSP